MVQHYNVYRALGIVLHDEVDAWFLDLCKSDPAAANQVAAAIDKLAADGPTLGRPLVDRVKASQHHNVGAEQPREKGVNGNGQELA